MFKFLKDKLKSAISKISEGVEKEGKVEETVVEKPVVAEEKKEQKEEKGFFAKLKDKFTGREEAQKEIKERDETAEGKFEQPVEKQPEQKKHVEEPLERKHPEKIYEPEHKKDIYQKEKTKEIIAEIKKEAEPQAEIKKHVEKDHPEEKHHKTEHEKKTETPIEKIKFTEEKKHSETKETHEKIIPKHVEQKKDVVIGKKHEEKKEETKEKIEPTQGKKGFFSALKEKIITTKIDDGQFEKLFWEMEIALLENNVAVEVIDKIKNDLKKELVDKPIRRGKVEDTILETLKLSIEELFGSSPFNLVEEIKNKDEKPYVIAFLGINGSGKTTSIAKMASMLKNKGFSVVLAAGDTFRAASIEQLNLHAEKVGVKLIKHDYGSDPAAVAFDAIKHAKSKNVDVVLIDTAGRMHSNSNLVEEMKKIIRVAKPNLKIFVGESITGNDCVEQAKTFNEAVGIDGIILAKADIDEKGGAAISVSYVIKKPILFLGTGQEYKDLEPFDKERIIKNIGLV